MRQLRATLRKVYGVLLYLVPPITAIIIALIPDEPGRLLAAAISALLCIAMIIHIRRQTIRNTWASQRAYLRRYVEAAAASEDSAATGPAPQHLDQVAVGSPQARHD